MKKQNIINSASISFGILVILFAVGFYAFGWVEPTVTPPNNNVAAPITVSSDSQVKSGALQTNGFRNIGDTIFEGQTTLNGALKIVSGAGIGKSLVSDAFGNATWQSATAPSGGLYGICKITENLTACRQSMMSSRCTETKAPAICNSVVYNCVWNDPSAGTYQRDSCSCSAGYQMTQLSRYEPYAADGASVQYRDFTYSCIKN